MLPVLLSVVFTTVVAGAFNLSELMPLPLALAAGLALGVVVGLGARWLRAKPIGGWLEDGFVGLGAVAFAFAGCGGLMAILLLNGTLGSSSVTGETLESTFLPSIPYYIAVNSALELLIVPAVLVLGWRPGLRRVLILVTAAAYFAMRIWTYLAFVPARLGWADEEHSRQMLTAGERTQAANDLMLNDPRWILLLALFAVFVIAMALPARRPAELGG